MQCGLVLLLSVAFPAVQYFSTLSHKRKDIPEKKIYYIQNVCFTFLYNFRLKLFLYKKNWETYEQKYEGWNFNSGNTAVETPCNGTK
jgi:hypothetical protein